MLTNTKKTRHNAIAYAAFAVVFLQIMLH